MRYFLTLYEYDSFKNTINRDASLVLRIESANKPQYLTDFLLGEAEFIDGYSGQHTKYNISLYEDDNRRLKLTIPESIHYLKVSPSFMKEIDPITNNQTLVELPLHEKQILYISFSWKGCGSAYLANAFNSY